MGRHVTCRSLISGMQQNVTKCKCLIQGMPRHVTCRCLIYGMQQNVRKCNGI